MKRNILVAAVLPLFLASRLLAATPGSAPAAAPKEPEPSYLMLDLNVSNLVKGVAELSECADVAEYLAASADKTDKKLKGPAAEVPSHMAALPPLKHKMADTKRTACLSQGGALSAKFDETMEMLATFEPNSAKGLAPRRAKVQALRAKANAQLTRLGAKLPKAARGKAPANAEQDKTTETP